jgi:hypothetical protein
MAIGDNTNPNLFGTNYNPEDEEEKKARLAAQNARIGAGNIPASAFGQAPAVAPFSLEAAGQVNPMMQPQSLAVPPQLSAGLPVETSATMTNDVANGGMQLREPKQTDGGALGLGSVDAESPFAITGSPDFRNLNLSGINLQIPPELQFDTPGTGEVGLTNLFQEGSLPRMVTEAAGATGDFAMDKTKDLSEFLTGQNFFTRDKTASEVEGSLAFLQSPEVQASMKAAQAPSGASALGATPSVTPPVETPSEGAQGQGAGQTSTAPTNGLTTVGGASLSEFLSGQAMPEQGFTEAERPLSGRGVTLTPDQMNELSAQRKARLDARPDFGEAVSDRDRRAARGDGISMADQTAMAKANARDASPSEVARGNQVANALGVDLETGQPLQATGGLTFDQQLALRKQKFAEGKFDYELAKDANATYLEGIEASKKATTEEAQADTAGRTMVSAISNMNDAMTRMGGRSGEFFGSGFFGKASSFIPGTSAYDQVADVEFLQSNVALNAMSELKELSPTGSTGFGALSEKELRVLTDKYANLNPFTSPDLFQKNLAQLQGEFNNMLNNAWNKHSKEYSPEAANAIYGNRGGSAGGATGTPSQAIPNDRNVPSASDALLSDPKYN